MAGAREGECAVAAERGLQQRPAGGGGFAGGRFHGLALDGAVQELWVCGVGDGVRFYVLLLGFCRFARVRGIV